MWNLYPINERKKFCEYRPIHVDDIGHLRASISVLLGYREFWQNTKEGEVPLANWYVLTFQPLASEKEQILGAGGGEWNLQNSFVKNNFQ